MDSSDMKARLKNQEMFRKRSKTVFHKADQLASKCGARVYCLLQRDNKFYQYTSSVEPAWPPSKEDMVNSLHPHRVSKLTELFSSVSILFLSSGSLRAFEAPTLWTQEEIYRSTGSLNVAGIQRSRWRPCPTGKKRTRMKEIALKMRRYHSKPMRSPVKLHYGHSSEAMNNSLECQS